MKFCICFQSAIQNRKRSGLIQCSIGATIILQIERPTEINTNRFSNLSRILK